jgi:hypothetical protein
VEDGAVMVHCPIHSKTSKSRRRGDVCSWATALKEGESLFETAPILNET